MSNPVATPSWTNGTFVRRYWGFLWRGVAAGLVATTVIGHSGVLNSIQQVLGVGETAPFIFPRSLLLPFMYTFYGVPFWGALCPVTALVPALLWPRIRNPLTPRGFWTLFALALCFGLLAEIAAVSIHILVTLDGPITSWEVYHSRGGGTVLTCTLLVMRWTPEARDYRRRCRETAKVERSRGLDASCSTTTNLDQRLFWEALLGVPVAGRGGGIGLDVAVWANGRGHGLSHEIDCPR